MRDHTLNIGEVKTFDHPVTLTCHGLGSCVGLFVQDRTKGITGGAHILLPDDDAAVEEGKLWYSVSKAVNRILEQFQRKGSLLDTLRAKVAGGANILNSTFGVGQRNVESVVNELIRRRIYIAALDVGGQVSRTAKFDSDSGSLVVRTVETNNYKVL